MHNLKYILKSVWELKILITVMGCFLYGSFSVFFSQDANSWQRSMALMGGTIWVFMLLVAIISNFIVRKRGDKI